MAVQYCLASSNNGWLTSWQTAKTTYYTPDFTNNILTTTTSYQYSTAVALTAVNYDGVLVCCQQTGSPSVSDTIYFKIYNGSEQALVIVYAQDLPVQPSYVFFKTNVFAGSASTVWQVGVRDGTNAGKAKFYTTGNANQIISLWRQSDSTPTPTTSDVFFCAGELTGGSANTPRVVTMDNTDTTIFGAINIGHLGTIANGTSASTTYKLYAGPIQIYGGGELDIGTSGTPVPSTSTALYQLAGQTLNVNAGGTFKTYGATKTLSALLAVDASGGATSLTTDISTGWLSGDSIALTPTTTTYTHAEKKALTGDAVGTALSIAAITNARTGTAPYQAELCNLTRNVQISGTNTTTATKLIFTGANVTVNMRYTECLNIGTSYITGTAALNFNTGNAPAIDIQQCSFHETTSSGAMLCFVNTGNGAGNWGSINIAYNVFYNMGYVSRVGVGYCYPFTIDHNYFILQTANAQGTGALSFPTNPPGGSITNNVFTGLRATCVLCINAQTPANLDGNSFHGCGGTAFNYEASTSNPGLGILPVINNWTIWRMAGYGLILNQFTPITFNNLNMYSNTTAHVFFYNGTYTFNNSTFNAGTTTVTTEPFTWTSSIIQGPLNVTCNACSFGATTPHAVTMTTLTNQGMGTTTIKFKTCTLSDTSFYDAYTPTTLVTGSRVAKYGDTIAVHNVTISGNNIDYLAGYFKTNSRDVILYNVDSCSERITAWNIAAAFAPLPMPKVQSTPKQVIVPSGQHATVSVSCYKADNSKTAQPRLVRLANYDCGLTSDEVVATMTDTQSTTWVTLSGTTTAVPDKDAILQFVVDTSYVSGTGATAFICVENWQIA
jgi:hypothetical protein